MECRELEVATAEGTSLESQASANRTECQEQCRSTPTCNAIAWGRADGQCHMKQGFDLGATSWNPSEDIDFCWEGCPHATEILAGSACDVLHNHQPSARLANLQELPPALHCWHRDCLAPHRCFTEPALGGSNISAQLTAIACPTTCDDNVAPYGDCSVNRDDGCGSTTCAAEASCARDGDICTDGLCQSMLLLCTGRYL